MSENLAKAKLVIRIDQQHPEQSYGVLRTSDIEQHFSIGTGRHGILPEGSSFKDGYSLLGEFKVTGILSADKFELAPETLAMSTKPSTYLQENLFKNMSAIDFDDDGKASEYGLGYIALTPINDSKQPFNFGDFRGQYRWYNYAIHGTNDESRIGKKSTGGCINVSADSLQLLLKEVKLGDLVTIAEK